MNIEILKPQQQAKGRFDRGRFVEQRPISFPDELTKISRVGPLFYWAWGHASATAEIGLHPHEGFEIITYVIDGEVHHMDTLGTKSVVTTGGAQLMQTGSGVSHAETIVENSEIFQIWFEPHLREALKRTPTYFEYGASEFPMIETDGVTMKYVLGNDSPMNIVTDAQMTDVSLSAQSQYTHLLASNRSLAILAIRGDGTIALHNSEQLSFSHKDLIVVKAGENKEVTIEASEQDVRLFIIEVPETVDYPLYLK